MNAGMKCGLWFLGGIVLGALGVAAASKGGAHLKPLAADLLSRGMDVKDAVMTKVETAKENVEDLVAEAKHASEQRKNAKTTDASA